MSQTPPPVLAVQGLSCTRALDRESPSRVRDASLSFEERTITVLRGREGCGKNLLLRLLGLMEVPDRGDVLLRGLSTARLSEKQRAAMRSKHFGFLFAAPFLLPSFTLVENVAMPLFKISSVNTAQAQERTRAVLEFVGLGDQAQASVEKMPSSDQQRASLARALVNMPELLMVENADALLEGDERAAFLSLLQDACNRFGLTVILTASGDDVAAFANRVIDLEDGSVVEDARVLPRNPGVGV
jgi:ABC-type lipoprotein export system ATPase subunit